MTEQELINLLTRDVPRKTAGLSVGIGDDCAVIAGETHDLLVTTDSLFEGVHFNFDYTGNLLLGRKSLSVNLSDIAAMGGAPLFYTVSLGVPKAFQAERLERIYRGMKEVADEAGVALVGGDTCASKSGLVISVTVIGQTEKGKAILRSGARPGDAIYVTGTLGDSALGLLCFKNEARSNRFAPFLNRYNNPSARLDLGAWLSSTGLVSSMIDISDGLLADLGHIADMSKVGFKIDSPSIPMSQGFDKAARELGADPLEVALTGGEDYELVFTVAEKNIDKFEKQKTGHPVTRIGTITKDPEERGGFSFARTGFDHFA